MDPKQTKSIWPAARAFTMVELMVVMVIIALLATILLPSVNAARLAAKAAQVRALIYTLESGVNMFRSEEALGGNYPPSYLNTSPELYGAQTLVLALAGPALSGTYGFNGDINYLDASSGPPRGPFIEVSKVDMEKPSETRIGTAAVGNNNRLVFTDGFDMPVLYYKATGNADYPFDTVHNAPFVACAVGTYNLEGSVGWSDKNMNVYTEDPRIFDLTGTHGTYNRDSFILISAGPDRLYGSPDDIANFPVPKN